MPGLHGKIVHGDQLSWTFWTVEKGAVVLEHHHEQIMHVLEGAFEFILAGQTNLYTKGAVFIPPNVPHAGKALTSCQLMDIFSSVRYDYN